jgi:hypothetical protein
MGLQQVIALFLTGGLVAGVGSFYANLTDQVRDNVQHVQQMGLDEVEDYLVDEDISLLGETTALMHQRNLELEDVLDQLN